MSKNIIKLALAAIVASVKTQPRAELNSEAIADYTEKAKEAKAKGADSPFPPLVVFRDPAEKKDYLADGFHRRVALTKAGFEETEVELREGTQRDALKFALQANLEHGVRLSSADKLHNLNLALKDPEWKDYSNVQLGELIGATEGFVRKHRPVAAAPAARKTKGGKTIDTSRIGKKGGKAKPAKADKKGKKGKAASTTPAAPKEDVELQRALTRIATILGEEGAKVRKAIEDGVLELSAKDVKEWAQSSEARIKRIAPLVTDKRLKPKKAYEILDTEVTGDTKVSTLILIALTKGGECSEKVEGFTITVAK